jgi:hypothetical protein
MPRLVAEQERLGLAVERLDGKKTSQLHGKAFSVLHSLLRARLCY